MRRNLSGNRAENDGNTHSQNFAAIHHILRKLRSGICQNLSSKTFWMRIFARRTFLLCRCCSIHVKMCVLLTYSARKVKRLCWHMHAHTAVSAVYPMTSSPTFDSRDNEYAANFYSATPYGQAE